MSSMKRDLWRDCSWWCMLFGWMVYVSTYYSWREHHRYCRTTLSIMSLGWISAIQCNWLSWSNWYRTADLTLPCVCSATKMPNIKHPYQLLPYEIIGDCLSPTSYILLLYGKIIFIYIIVISTKMCLKSKLQRCLYVNFYQRYEDLWTGSTQQGGWVGPCPTPAGSSTAWPVMHETATRQL